GSLFRLSRSGAYPDAPHGLGFLEPAMGELLDEVETLQTNVHGLHNLSDALGTFNESFASWLYVMNMNALTTDWPQAPTDASFKLAARRAEEDIHIAMEALKAAHSPPPPLVPDTSTADTDPGNETTYGANTTTATTSGGTSSKMAGTKVIVKKKAKPKLTAKEKKERGIAIERVVTSLPLEFRGSDPNLRRHIELVVEGFLDRESRGVASFLFLHRRDEPGRMFDLDPNVPSFLGIKHEHKPSEEVMVDFNGGGTKLTVSSNGGGTKPTVSSNGGGTKPTVSFNGGGTKPTVSSNGGGTKPTVSSNGGGTKPTVNPGGSGAMDHKKMKVMEGSPNIPSSTGTSLTVKVYSTTYPPSTTSPSLSISIPASQATNILSPSTPNLASYSPTMVPSQQKSYPTTIAAIVLAAIVVVMGIILFVLFVRRSRTRRPSFVIALEKGSAFSLTGTYKSMWFAKRKKKQCPLSNFP
ncbi:hypothetical protein PHLCEN_2v4778, partial [Hermanssonia centrifuga]